MESSRAGRARSLPLPSATARRRGRRWRPGALAAALLLVGACGSRAPDLDAAAASIRAGDLARLTRTLAGDEFAGRGPAGPGEQRTLDFLRSEMERIGLAPGLADGDAAGYLQPVPVASITTDATSAALRVGGASGRAVDLEYARDFVVWSREEAPGLDVEAPLVFVGYGVEASEEGWHDYTSDVAGKIVVVLVNDPPVPGSFDDEAMTYYGRWTYKFEEAARQGAVGALILHDAGAAGYGWQVVRSSWTGQQFSLVRGAGDAPTSRFEGWISGETGRRILAAAGLDPDETIAAAATPAFEAIELGLTARLRLENEVSRIRSANVIGRIQGRDPAAGQEAILWMAHWDHLGFDPTIDGDGIYNGALDNATGLAGLLEIAEALASGAAPTRRSHVFVATTLEEKGLLGSAWYAANPVVPLNRTVAAINMDGLNVWGPTEDVTVIGLGNSELDDLLAAALEQQGRSISPDPEPEKGFFYRSDHFPLALAGVPSLYLDAGTRFRDRPADYGDRVRDEYTQLRYHRPADEYDPAWDFSGAVEDLRALLRVGMNLAESSSWPGWAPGSEFRAARERSLAER